MALGPWGCVIWCWTVAVTPEPLLLSGDGGSAAALGLSRAFRAVSLRNTPKPGRVSPPRGLGPSPGLLCGCADSTALSLR